MRQVPPRAYATPDRVLPALLAAAFFLGSPERAPGQQTGLAPVRLQGNVVVIEDDGSRIVNGRFVGGRIFPLFYSAFPDSFDFVNVFGASTFPEEMIEGAAQYLVRNDVAGLGRRVGLDRNAGIEVCTRRLKSIHWMRDIRHYGASPTDPIPRFSVHFTGVELLGSEALHMTSCWVNLDQVMPGIDILGRLGAHWSFFLDSGASVMEGCRWQDNGDGSFTSVAVLEGFSELDEYLLGLRPASEVSPMFIIADPDPQPMAGHQSFPSLGFTTWGTRVDFTIDDIIAQNGPRVPNASRAQHHFRMAFVLVVPEGTEAPPTDLAFLEQFRVDWEDFFHTETESLGTMDTTIPRVQVRSPERAPPLSVSPNPFVESTAIRFTLLGRESATASIYDLNGRLVRTLSAGRDVQGYRQIFWNGTNTACSPVASGVYFVLIETPSHRFSQRLVKMR